MSAKLRWIQNPLDLKHEDPLQSSMLFSEMFSALQLESCLCDVVSRSLFVFKVTDESSVYSFCVEVEVGHGDLFALSITEKGNSQQPKNLFFPHLPHGKRWLFGNISTSMKHVAYNDDNDFLFLNIFKEAEKFEEVSSNDSFSQLQLKSTMSILSYGDQLLSVAAIVISGNVLHEHLCLPTLESLKRTNLESIDFAIQQRPWKPPGLKVHLQIYSI